ncbi:succinate dehydrogenase, cytochrome b556 subunit [Ancylobacter terrae]|uniref:succinate dehydrogenase, cytochrome b556 subunit n=1 Tax=Ancylobacter sp. sgz301288 TaxID=3342077 RepID=UPI00385B3D4F
MSDMPGAANRPLSPHLQIYRPMLTMMMSIVHRITGVALYVGTLLLAWWLVAAATSPAAFATANAVLGSLIGKVVLFGYSWALIHHMLGGVRHFIWDTGNGFGPEARELFAKATIGGSIVLTILLWIVVVLVR